MTIYSVIIPTRDRHETLYHTIKSVLSLEEDNLEVVISDNCSSKETQEVVSQFKDSRLVYSRSPERLSMAANFERGIKLSQGDFITIIGDDDFIVPSAWEFLKPALTESKVISWFRYCYYWPNFPDASGILCASLSADIVEQDSSKILNLTLGQFLNYQFLPSFYNSWVSRSLIDNLVTLNQQAQLSKYIFPASTLAPDVYSALQLSMLSDQFSFCTMPFSVSGISNFSNGMGIKYKNKDSQSFVQECGYKSVSEAVYTRLSPIIEYLEILELLNQTSISDIYNSVLIASNHLDFIEKYIPLFDLDISVETALAAFLKRIEIMYSIPQELVAEIAEITDIDIQNLDSISLCNDFNFVNCYGTNADVFTVDTREWGVSNCYEAMLLYEKFLIDKKCVTNQF